MANEIRVSEAALDTTKIDGIKVSFLGEFVLGKSSVSPNPGHIATEGEEGSVTVFHGHMMRPRMSVSLWPIGYNVLNWNAEVLRSLSSFAAIFICVHRRPSAVKKDFVRLRHDR